jgi:hypothetical protein
MVLSDLESLKIFNSLGISKTTPPERSTKLEYLIETRKFVRYK